MTNEDKPRCQWCHQRWAGFNWERWRCSRAPNSRGKWCDEHDPIEQEKRREMQALMAMVKDTLETLHSERLSGGGRE